LKQTLVYDLKQSSKHAKKFCGFDLCPHKFKYLANPQLLDQIFRKPAEVDIQTAPVKKPSRLDKYVIMHTTECVKCKKEYLLPVENPICIICRRFI